MAFIRNNPAHTSMQHTSHLSTQGSSLLLCLCQAAPKLLLLPLGGLQSTSSSVCLGCEALLAGACLCLLCGSPASGFRRLLLSCAPARHLIK